jgi:hypothetical protein
LNNKGDALELRDSLANGGGVKDSLTFGLQLPDRSIGRSPDGSGEFTLNNPTPLAANVALPLGDQRTLKINEWSALNGPSEDDPDPDWFELYNPNPRPVALGGLVFTDDLDVPPVNTPLAALSFIDGRGFLQFFADDEDTPADNVDFRLSSTSGDRILLYVSDGATLIDSVSFGPQSLNVSQGRLPDGSTNIVFFRPNQPTPAQSNFAPINSVVISEVLTHTDPPLEDAIELQNVSDAPVDIGHWWLSNSRDDPKKFRIPAGTVLQPGGFVVFYEGVGSAVGFNTSGTGNSPDFTLNSAHGDELYLFTGDANGELTGFRRGIDVGAAKNGRSFGRYVTSTGEPDITAMSQRTFGVDSPSTVQQFRGGTGLTNAAPKTGSIVISEIMYHPPDLPDGTGTTDNARDEFIEMHNITSAAVPLFDPAFPTNTWRIRGGVDFDFPGNQSLAAGQTLLIVNYDPTDTAALSEFRNKFGVPSSVRIYGPYQGKLSNAGARIELQEPDVPQGASRPDAGFVPYISVDRVTYSDLAPWPASADGSGDSLQRRQLQEYANDPINWLGAPATAGTTGAALSILSIQRSGTTLTLCFTASAGANYSIQSKASLPGTTWTKVIDVTANATGSECVDTTISLAEPMQFYRVVTPAQP